MLILTRYNNQRIVVIAPDKSELWITATESGLEAKYSCPVAEYEYGDDIELLSSNEFELSGQTIAITHLETRGKSKPQHRIGIDAPKDYLILREELIGKQYIPYNQKERS